MLYKQTISKKVANMSTNDIIYFVGRCHEAESKMMLYKKFSNKVVNVDTYG